MIQAITIDGTSVEYSIDTSAIVAVLGTVYIYKQPTYEDILHIVYLGLKRNCGYTLDQFRQAVYKGQIYTSRRRNQYPLSAARQRIQARVKQINREFKITGK